MSYRPDLYEGRRVVVVGGSSGIGEGIARAFAQHGASVLATGATAAEVAAAEARQHGTGLAYRVLDVRDDAAVHDALGGDLDVLVNCAGIIRRGLAEHDPAVFADVVDINLNGTIRACTAARGALRSSRGCIINTASMLSFFGGGAVPARDPRAHADGPLGPAGGRGAGGALSRLPRRIVHHRRGAAGGRRLPHRLGTHPWSSSIPASSPKSPSPPCHRTSASGCRRHRWSGSAR